MKPFKRPKLSINVPSPHDPPLSKKSSIETVKNKSIKSIKSIVTRKMSEFPNPFKDNMSEVSHRFSIISKTSVKIGPDLPPLPFKPLDSTCPQGHQLCYCPFKSKNSIARTPVK